MAKRIALMIGTRKGAFLVFSDEASRSWDLKGPFFKGVEVNHVGCLPRANVVTATFKSAWWDPHPAVARRGRVVGRNCSPSDDGGHNRQEVRGLNDPPTHDKWMLGRRWPDVIPVAWSRELAIGRFVI
jgi:hypothetical protein